MNVNLGMPNLLSFSYCFDQNAYTKTKRERSLRDVSRPLRDDPFEVFSSPSLKLIDRVTCRLLKNPS